MRLAFFNSTRKWGGVKTWTLEFAAALRDAGHDLIVLGREGPFIERAVSMGLDARPVRFGTDYNPVAIARFFRLFRREGVQGVLVNVGHDLRTAGIAARLCGIPVVQRIGLPQDMKNDWKVHGLHRWVRPHYLFPCVFNRDGMLNHLPYVDIADTSVILSAKIPAACPSSTIGHPLQLITTSQLNAAKGHVGLLHALASLRAAGHAFHWHVVGTGTQEGSLKSLAQSLRLEDCVTWHGWTQDVRAILRQADVFILPSQSEGLPNTLLEAMAEGLIPVAYNVGGIAEAWPGMALQDEAQPRPHTVPHAPINELADCLIPFPKSQTTIDRGEALLPILERLLTLPEETLLAWKRNTWQHCAEHFTIPTQAAKLEKLFLRLVHAPKTNTD